MITCKKATEFIIQREEGKISFRQRVQLWLHMGVCGLCKLFYKQSSLISKTIHHLHEHIDDQLSAAEKEIMINALGREA